MALSLPLVTVSHIHCRQTESRADPPPPIEIKAIVQPAQSMAISAQIDGQVRSVSVREGTKISANVPFVELSNPTVERDAAIVRAQLDWVEARMRRGSQAPRSSAARPRDSMEIAKTALDLRGERVEKMRQLRKSGDVTGRELELAELEYLGALREYNHERQAAVGGGAGPAPDDADLLRIEQQKSLAEQRFAAQRQSLLQIASPIAGTVTRVFVATGQAVFPRDPIAEVSNLATLHVRGTVAPELLRYLRPGMRVEVKVFSVPPRNFVDEIEYVIPVQGASSESRTATVIVAIPNPDGSLQPNTEALITLRPFQ